MVGITDAVLISNMMVTIGLFLATLYRIKIERRQVEIIIQNAKAAENIRLLREYLQREAGLLENTSREDLLKLLKEVAGL